LEGSLSTFRVTLRVKPPASVAEPGDTGGFGGDLVLTPLRATLEDDSRDG
jgi:hypothetical protein